ncbi:MAG: hypothetical protein ACNA8K_13445 [Cyclonatronaceae bacterium]
MKKILSIFLLLLVFTASDACAQIEAYIGVGAGYNSEIEATSLRFYGGVPASEFFTYFVDGGIYFRDAPRAGDANANLRFMIPGSDVFRPYIYTGINYTRFGDDYIGANLGAGAQFMARPGFFFVRGQYTLGGLNMLSASAGFSYMFRTAIW